MWGGVGQCGQGAVSVILECGGSDSEWKGRGPMGRWAWAVSEYTLVHLGNSVYYSI